MSRTKEYYQELHDSIPAGYSYWEFYEGDTKLDAGTFTPKEAMYLAMNILEIGKASSVEVINLFPDLTDPDYISEDGWKSYYQDTPYLGSSYTLMKE